MSIRKIDDIFCPNILLPEGGETEKLNTKKILKKLKLAEQNLSMAIGALILVIIGILIFNYFRGVNKETVAPQPTPAQQEQGVKLIEEDGKIVPEGLPTTHVVVAGEDLWKISEIYYGSGYNWVDIAKENKITNSNRILVGQELIIPKVEVKSVTTKVTTQTVTPSAVADKGTEKAITGSDYTIVKGDSLWTIAVRVYQDGYRWAEIAKANNIKNPNIIHAGNVITLPTK